MSKYLLVLVFQFGIVSLALSQTATSSDVDLYRLPAESYGVFIAYQPNSPLRFERVEGFVSRKSKTPFVNFVIHNRFSRNIKFFQVDFYKSFTSGDWGRYGVADGLAIGKENGPGTVVLSSKGVFENLRLRDRVIIDSKEQLFDLFDRKVNFDRPVVLWFAKVTKVVFEDGTVFEDRKDLTNFFGFVNY